jgi:hypothetical protein
VAAALLNLELMVDRGRRLAWRQGRHLDRGCLTDNGQGWSGGAVEVTGEPLEEGKVEVDEQVHGGKRAKEEATVKCHA